MADPLLATSILDVLSHFATSFPILLALHLVQIILFLLVIRFLDFNEREPIPVVLGMFLWGGIAAVLFAGTFNTIIGAMLPADFSELYGAAVTAPIFEEIGKGAAIALAFFLTVRFGKRFGNVEFGGVTDGIVYGFAVGAGFAFIENVHYFVNVAAQSGVEASINVFLMRVDFLGLHSGLIGHGVYSALVGAGLGLAIWTNDRRQRLIYVGGGFALAALAHASWNGIVNFLLVRRFGADLILHLFRGGSADAGVIAQVEGAIASYGTVRDVVHLLFVAGVIAAFVLWMRYESRIIRFELDEELVAGRLTAEEHAALTSIRGRGRWYSAVARAGRFETLRVLRQSHDKLIELAMHKWRVRTLGGDPAKVVELQAEVAAYRDLSVRIAEIESGPATSPTPAPDASAVAAAPVG